MSYPKIPDFNKLGEWFKLFAQLKSEHGSKGVGKVLLAAEKSMKAYISELEKLPIDENLAKKEPNDLKSIRELRPSGPRRIWDSFDKQRYMDRIEGALLGRFAGCILGAPVEFWPVEKMQALAKENGDDFPPTDYWSYVPEPERKRYPSEKGKIKLYTRDGLNGVPVDDDIVYTILGLLIAEEFGLEFTTADVGQAWVRYLPFAFSAEDMACKNLKKGISPLKCAEKNNPYREWIGAAIRSDPWGYIAVGWPERAATMAYRDAYISHRRQGIYGEMFFAAVISAAFVFDDAMEAVKVGLTEIPCDCAFAKAVRWALKVAPEIKNYKQARRAVDEKFKGMHGVHVIINACLTIFGLKIGNKDFTKVIGQTVAMGLDNDCTAATAGSIAGAILGKKGIPEYWYKNFNDTVYSYLIGKKKFRISKLAKRFAKQAEKAYEVFS